LYFLPIFIFNTYSLVAMSAIAFANWFFIIPISIGQCQNPVSNLFVHTIWFPAYLGKIDL
jgi:hypothetical protein